MKPALAVITRGAHGGGVATVSRLLWEVFRDRWGDDATLMELMPDSPRIPERLSLAACLRFGARLAIEQARSRERRVFYGHLSVARVQDFVPPFIRRPYAVFLHGIEAWRPLSPHRYRILAGAAVRVANSHYTASRVRSAHPALGPIQVCRLALPRTMMPPPTIPLVAPDAMLGAHAVLVVGRMLAAERYKGHDELLDSWPAVLREVPDARLVFVGDGDDVERLRAKARDLGVGSSLVVTGFVTAARLRELYRGARVFAMPSREEGFGLVYLEAMAHGLPCLGSRHDAAGEIIADGETGALVDQRDRNAIARHLSDWLRDPERSAAMGRAGRTRVQQQFSYERFRDDLLALLAGAFEPAAGRSRLTASAGDHAA